MNLEQLANIAVTGNFELLAKQVVEGFITGLHRSPFHGFSVEFAEHRLYNNGESTRHIDWKLYARTDKLYVKRYDEETNLRCHIILDNSASMHFPQSDNTRLQSLNKIGYSALAAASLMRLLKKQRDAVGMSVYSDHYEYFAPEKGSTRHHRRILKHLESLLSNPAKSETKTHRYIPRIADRLHRRSLVFIFTDMWQSDTEEEKLFESLRYLKFNKHEIVLFHVYDGEKEFAFDYDNIPTRFVDVETGKWVQLFPGNVKENYAKEVEAYFNRIKLKCLQYKIDYAPIDITRGFDQVLSAYLIKRNKMM